MKIEQFKLYEDDPNVTLTAYILDDSPEMTKGKKRPAFLVCPGGAYMFTSDREAEPVAIRFAAMGYHAFVLRYSVYSNSGVRFPMPGKSPAYEKGVFPGPMREIGMAMLKIREHAEEWKVDMDRIILNGGSAGANNCAEYAVHYSDPVIYEYLNAKPEDLRPAAAVLAYGVYDYALMHKTLQKLGDKDRIELNRGFNLAFFGDPDPSEETMAEGSPVNYIKADTPPMFLWTTREDSTVPMNQTLSMALAMEEAGIPCETHIFENGDHGLSLADQSCAEAKEQINPDVAEWINLAETWLKKRFSLDMPDKCPDWRAELGI
ncbi:MAG: alpha/beta hydrolase [Blautia sp.]|nr:alpha/beta hydrolase [Blautia sp.]